MTDGDTIVVASPRSDPAAVDRAFDSIVDLTVAFPLTGDGPWRLQLPGGELLLDVRTPTKAYIGVTIGAENDVPESVM